MVARQPAPGLVQVYSLILWYFSVMNFQAAPCPSLSFRLL